MQIRQATSSDALQLLNIYGPIVEDTAISFEKVVPSAEEFSLRITASVSTHDWLVMASGSELCGYAYATPHRAREAYRHSVETSVYVGSNYQGQGIGKLLYTALFDSLRKRDFHNAYAGITLPNEGSVALHESLGFYPIGVFQEVGFKQGRWHDVGWWQRPIAS